MRGKLTISLDAIQKNYSLLNDKTVNAICAAVVKANAYGLGIKPIATALSESGATHFFVALLEEAIELRQILSSAQIFVLNGLLNGEENIFVEHQLTPVLNDKAQFDLWQKTAANTGKTLPAVIHVDTGLNRLGFNASDFESLSNFSNLDIQFVMSHLACADAPQNPINQLQLERFNHARKHIPNAKGSLAASDGIFCGANFHQDLVRPGAALYGLNPTPSEKNPMHPVVQLSVPILQIRTVAQDGFVGYGASFAVKAGQRLATVSLGYADGFSRQLGNKGKLFYQGTDLPVVGRVSMDVIVVDISALPENTVRAGDWLEVFGPDQSPDDLAKAAGTIGYEIITALGQRFERVYQS